MTTTDPTTEKTESAGASGRVAEVLRLFREELRDVSFPDVSSQILEQRASELAERQIAVEAARARLREAEGALDQARRELGVLTERAVAYARVFAAGNPTLEQALDHLAMPRPRAKGTRRREPHPVRGSSSSNSEPQRHGTTGKPAVAKRELHPEPREAEAEPRHQLALS